MRDIISMSEILAPAGNAECADAAINAGADAIYLGYSSFSARAGAGNFDLDSLRATLEKAHFLDVKVYVAMNTLVKDSETEAFIRTLLEVWNAGADAIIMQDVLLGRFIHSQYPDIVLHLSTQAGVNNLAGAKFAKECGFSRVILARETPLKEIEEIASFMETEVFVQGALCTCFSGQCYFSSFAGGNSGNRGRCKQPCRKLYSYDRTGFGEKAYALSLSDLCVSEDIEKLRRAGVASFKIEGRMRRAEYVAAAVRFYRRLSDGTDEKEKAAALSDLKRTYNRGNYTSGLAFGQDKRFLSRSVQGHIGERVGTVKVAGGKYFVESSFRPEKGDGFKILRKGKEVGGALFDRSESRGFYLISKARLMNGDGVFVTTDSAVNRRVLSGEKLLPVFLSLDFKKGEKAVVKVRNGCEIRVESDEILASAKASPLTEKELAICFGKRDCLPLDVKFEKVNLDENIFIAKSCLNALRRKAYSRFFAERAKTKNTQYSFSPFHCPQSLTAKEKEAIIACDFPKGAKTDIFIYKPQDYSKKLPEGLAALSLEKYLYYPAFAKNSDLSRIAELLVEGDFDGIYAENYGGLIFAREHKTKLFAGTGFNLTNALAVSALLENPEVSCYALSKELDEREQAALGGEKAFVLSEGGIKLMDLCYCPFEKTCKDCDKKYIYTLTDESGRTFPVHRYRASNGDCRFEIYNYAELSKGNIRGMGRLIDATLPHSEAGEYTSGHRKKSVL